MSTPPCTSVLHPAALCCLLCGAQDRDSSGRAAGGLCCHFFNTFFLNKLYADAGKYAYDKVCYQSCQDAQAGSSNSLNKVMRLWHPLFFTDLQLIPVSRSVNLSRSCCCSVVTTLTAAVIAVLCAGAPLDTSFTPQDCRSGQ